MSRAWRWLAIAFTLRAIPTIAYALDVPAKVAPYSLVRVKLDEGERCFVLAADLSPVEIARIQGGLVFTGPPGRYAVLAFTDNESSQRIVTIGTDPGPGPKPPIPPGPAPDVPNAYGVGKIAYDQAVRVARPAHCTAIAGVFDAASVRLLSLNSPDSIDDINLVVREIHDQTTAAVGADVSLWSPWRASMNEAFNALWRSGRTTKADCAGAFKEVSIALRQAALAGMRR